MYTELLQVFKNIAPISKEEEQLITRSFKPYTLEKGACFLKAGETAKYIGFLRKGLVRYFVYKNDEEATFEFTKEGEFISDYQSFNNNTASIQSIQAIEDCELLIIDYKDVQYIFNNTPHGNLLGRIIVEHRFDVMVGQLLSIYMHNPEERYLKFQQNYADLLQRIPQYMIASYVGVQPQSLSRIRKRFSQSSS